MYYLLRSQFPLGRSPVGTEPRAQEEMTVTEAIHINSLKLDEESQRAVSRMRAIEAELSANGLTTHLTDARAGLDLSAVLSPSGTREAEIWVDEDGYVEVRYWSPPGASAAQITATALRALRAITGSLSDPTPTVTGDEAAKAIRAQ
jgi:hypothetical protein